MPQEFARAKSRDRIAGRIKKDDGNGSLFVCACCCATFSLEVDRYAAEHRFKRFFLSDVYVGGWDSWSLRRGG